MTPRSLDDLYPIDTIMSALGTVMIQNTQMQLANGSVMINSRTPLYQANATWPSLVIYEGPQSVARIHWQLWQAKLVALAVYMDRYDSATITIDQVWKNIDADLRRMQANLQDNPRLVVSGSQTALDLTQVMMSPYVGTLNEKDFAFPVVERSITIHINIPPFSSAG